MNPLIDYTYLFSNGQFRVGQWISAEESGREKGFWYHIPWDGGHNGCDTLFLTDDSGYIQEVYRDNSDCKLVARSISDMTDTELIKWGEVHIDNERANVVDASIEGHGLRYRYDEQGQRHVVYTDLRDLTAREEHYLLSFGVYPFSQKHFDTGLVLNINEVDELDKKPHIEGLIDELIYQRRALKYQLNGLDWLEKQNVDIGAYVKNHRQIINTRLKCNKQALNKVGYMV